MSYLTEFDGKAFQSVAKADESLEKLADEVDESTKEAEKRWSRSLSVLRARWVSA